MNKVIFKTSGLQQGIVIGLLLTAIFLLINSFILKLSTSGILIFYFINIITSVIISLYFFRGQIQLEIKDDFLHIKWTKKPFYTTIKDSKIKLDTILKSQYLTSSRGPNTIKIISKNNKTPLSIKVSSSNSEKTNIESGFHKTLVSKINKSSSLEPKLVSSYYHKYTLWITKVKISIFTLIAASIISAIYLAFNGGIKIIEYFFITSFFGLVLMVLLLEFYKYTQKEFLLE